MKTCKQFQIVIKVYLKTLGDAREKIFNRSLIEPILRKKNSTKNISLELTEICRTATFLNARRARIHWTKTIVQLLRPNAANIYLFKVNNRNTRKRCEICSKVNNKNTRTTSYNLNIFPHVFLVFLLLTLGSHFEDLWTIQFQWRQLQTLAEVLFCFNFLDAGSVFKSKKNHIEVTFEMLLTFTCSKSPLEALEKGVKYVQSQQ